MPDSAGASSKIAPICSLISDFRYHVFISHNWGDAPEYLDHQRAKRLNESLKSREFVTWFDEELMTDMILDKMAKGIEESAVIVVCVTRKYVDKVAQEENPNDNCKAEFNHARRMRQAPCMLAVVMEEEMTDQRRWNGSVGLTLGDHLFAKLTCDADDEFEQSVDEIAAKLMKKIRRERAMRKRVGQ